MACRKEGNNIFLTRGDTLYLEFLIAGPDGNPYEMQLGDSVKFAMKRRLQDAAPCILKDIDPDTLVLKLEPEDTKELTMNCTYIYDVELTKANGDVCTFISGNFTVTGEVH